MNLEKLATAAGFERQGTLTQLSSTNNRLRTTAVLGVYDTPPRVGHRFTMLSTPLDPLADGRLVQTSEILEVEFFLTPGGPPEYIFRTQNSEYRLTNAPVTKDPQ